MSRFAARIAFPTSFYRLLTGGLLSLAVATGAVASPGELDDSFGDGDGNGKGWTNFSEYPYTASPDTANASVLQPDGKLLVGGSFTSVGSTARNRDNAPATWRSLPRTVGTQRACALCFSHERD